MTSQIVVRECRLVECAAVLAIWKESEAVTTTTDTLEELSRLVEECPGSLLIAELDGCICGTVIGAAGALRGRSFAMPRDGSRHEERAASPCT